MQRQLLAAMQATVLVLLILVPVVTTWNDPPVIGDGPEYIAMLVSLAQDGSPSLRPDFAALHADPSRNAAHIDGASVVQPALRGADGRTDFWHFWFYSLLALPFYGVVGFFHGAPTYAFALLNVALLALAFAVAYRNFALVGVAAMAMVTIASPAFWFVTKAHTEIFTVAWVSIAVFALLKQRMLGAFWAFSLAATQNPPFLFAAAGVATLMLWRERTALLRPSRLAAFVGAGLVGILHPVYYLWRLHVITPQLINKAASGSVTVSKALAWFIDPDIGLFWSWPVGVALLIVGVLQLRRSRPHSTYDVTLMWAATAFVVVMACSQARTINVNHGGTVHVSRYAMWYLPLFLPACMGLVNALGRRLKSAELAAIACTMASLAIGYMYYSPGAEEACVQHSAAARLLYDKWPALYDPYPEVFIERSAHMEVPWDMGDTPGEKFPKGFLWAVGNDTCTKILVLRSLLPDAAPAGTIRPMGCGISVDAGALYTRSQAYFSRNATSYKYFNLSHAERDALALYPAYTPGDILQFGDDRVLSYLGTGWSVGEGWGRWSEGTRAQINFAFNDASTPAQASMIVHGKTIQPLSGTPRVTVELNGKAVGDLDVRAPGQLEDYVVSLPSHLLQRQNTLTFVLHTVTPLEQRLHGPDARLLGFAVTSWQLRDNHV